VKFIVNRVGLVVHSVEWVVYFYNITPFEGFVKGYGTVYELSHSLISLITLTVSITPTMNITYITYNTS
jgi:hypothetical protein